MPASSYHPVVIIDPGPDFIPGTFDDKKLVVYAQGPATLGHDQSLLTNPAGVRELTEAIVATAGTRYHLVDLRASFTVDKSFGPTNPGNATWENDPGIVVLSTAIPTHSSTQPGVPSWTGPSSASFRR